MDKPKQPTSEYHVFCDTFETKATVKIHEADGKQKLLLTIGNDEDKTQAISLYREDVLMMIGFLQAVQNYTEDRTIIDLNALFGNNDYEHFKKQIKKQVNEPKTR